MVEASDGKVGSPFDQFLLFCFHYDAEAGRYAPVARRIMSVGGALTVLLLGGTLSLLWVRDARRRRRRQENTTTPPEH
jgi:protein SCO1/2